MVENPDEDELRQIEWDALFNPEVVDKRTALRDAVLLAVIGLAGTVLGVLLFIHVNHHP